MLDSAAQGNNASYILKTSNSTLNDMHQISVLQCSVP